MFYSEQKKKKKFPSEELEQMKAGSNVIKQCGIVTDYHSTVLLTAERRIW